MFERRPGSATALYEAPPGSRLTARGDGPRTPAPLPVALYPTAPSRSRPYSAL
jgi:hypothetical protein